MTQTITIQILQRSFLLLNFKFSQQSTAPDKFGWNLILAYLQLKRVTTTLKLDHSLIVIIIHHA